MQNRQDVIKAFRNARIAGEQLLSTGRISWDEYAFTMLGYEQALKEMGVNL